jgi:DNA-binding MarR family transcriptional regulator
LRSTKHASEVTVAGDSFGHLLRRSAALMSQIVERRLEPDGLTHAQGLALLKLYLGQANTVADLARICAIDPGGMTRLLDRMEKKGLISRARCPDDRRVVRLELTPKGHALGARFPLFVTDLLGQTLSGFSTQECDSLVSLMSRVLDNLEAIRSAGE